MATQFLNGIDVTNQRIQNVGSPSQATDAVTKSYVDAQIRGLRWEMPARVAPTGNITISSPGGTIDTVTMASGDRVLLMFQTAGAENGVYVWNGAAVPLTRAADANAQGDLDAGTTLTVTEGTVYGGKVFHVISPATGPIGTTATVWGQLGGSSVSYVNGAGLDLTGTTFSVKTKVGGGVIADGTGVYIDTTKFARIFSANVGDGTATTVTLTHNFATYDVGVTVFTASGQRPDVMPDITRPSVNTVALTFATAPTSGAYRALVVG
ncbi:putative tail fiber protein [Rhodococcus phage E3]|uniref:head decoration n=1 Tax=Rhodococcus phage E3 TaxID=1007869 RepID=UPI0002C6D1F7|nr:head decoration [Rhodococcus phage E3]AEQ21001.1 putative tail fiber protein [Rhodococcus phage E3]